MKDKLWLKLIDAVVLVVFLVIISDFFNSGFWGKLATVVVAVLTVAPIWRKRNGSVAESCS